MKNKLNLLVLVFLLIILIWSWIMLLLYIYPLVTRFPLAIVLFILSTVATFSITLDIIKLLTNFILTLIRGKLKESTYELLVLLSPLSDCVIAVTLCEQYYIPLDYFISLINA